MLKFLTHKLRTHSLNEESVSEKVEEHDSGTESDDEADRAPAGYFCTDVIMKWNDVTDISMCGGAGAGAGSSCVCAPGAGAAAVVALAPPQPDPDQLYDHHSSEEELEVINGLPAAVSMAGSARGAGGESRRRGASSPPPAQPEKRKWPSPPAHTRPRPTSDDDDDTKVETPVRFRTSPPLEALKPRRAGAGCACIAGGVAGAVTVAGASAVSRAPGSPRRRRVALPPPRRHRPALDFDKMQQLRVGGAGGGGAGGAGGGARAWRAVGGPHGAGGELSVFCW